MAITDAEIQDPNVRKFFDYLSAAEGTTKYGYNTQVGNTKVDDLSQHPNKPTVTTADGTSTAFGRYQFTNQTWGNLARKEGLSDMSPVNQDRAAAALLKEKGAYEDVVKGNFVDAIHKTGDVWASLPSSKYKQPKRSWDWTNAFLGTDGKPKDLPDTTSTTNDTVFRANGLSPSARINKQNEEDKAKAATSFWDNIKVGAEAGMQNDSSVVNWFKSVPENTVVDPNFKKDEEFVTKMSEGVKPDHLSYIYNNATSQAHAEQLKQRAIEFDQIEEKYKKAGISAAASRLVTGMFTPENLGVAALALVAPELGAPLAASRIGRIGYGALEGAAVNGVMEAAGNQFRPDATSSDMPFALAMGGVFGGIGGAFARGAKARIADGTNHLFDHDLANIQNWSLDQLHGISSMDYANMRMHMEGEKWKGVTGEARMHQELRYAMEYDNLVKTKRDTTIHGTGDIIPPAAVKAGEAPKAEYVPKWSKEWDTPTYLDKDGRRTLQLPPNLDMEGYIHYIKKFDTENPAMVKWLDKMLEGIDLKNLDSLVLSGQKGLPNWYHQNGLLGKASGHVSTQLHSLGTKNYIEGMPKTDFVLQGRAKNAQGDRYVAKQGDSAAARTGLTSTTFIHEMVHVASAYKLRLVRNDLSNRVRENIVGDAKTIAATKGLSDLWNHVKDNHYDPKAKEYYGMKNVDEFLAEGLTNTNFQAYLKSIVLPDHMKSQTAYTKFVSTIMDLLGIDQKDNTAFHKLLELAEPLTDEGGIHLRGTTGAPADGYRVADFNIADQETVKAAETADLPEIFGRSLGLEHKTNASSVPKTVWALSRKLIGVVSGYKDNSVVSANAWEDMIMARDGWNTQLRKGTIFPFLEWEKSRGYKFHERGQAYEDFGTDVWSYVRGEKKEFDPQVVKAGETVRKNMADRVKNINNPSLEHGGQKKGLTEIELKGEDGSISYTGTLEENPFYMPRVHDINKWNDMVATHGQPKVEKFWASAYRSGREGEVSEKDAERFAKFYTQTINDAKNNSGANQHLSDMLRGQDTGALLDAIKKALPDLDPADLERFSNQILGHKKDDAGRIVGNLKHRNTIDELFVGAAGSDIEGWSLKDFVKTNAMEITESYNNRVAGNISLAHHLDVYKSNDVTKLIDDATRVELGTSYKDNHIKGARTDLQFIFDRILGVPQEQGFSAVGQTMSMFRDFNVIRLMSGAVYNQLVETTQITGTVGYKALLHSIPQLDGLARDLKTGKAPSDLLNHFENVFGGAGAEYLTRLDFSAQDAWGRQYGKDSWQGKYLDKTAGAMKKMASGVLDYTGMTPLMVQQKRLHVTALVNGFIDLAHGIDNGGAKRTLTKDRLAWMGLSEEDFGNLKTALKKYSSEGEGVIKTTATKVDWEKFASEETELHHKMARAVMRESRRVIQENDLASMIPFMGSTLGKTMFQFMNFSMNAWNKQMLFGLNHADAASLNTLMQGVFLGSLVYSARMYQQSLGMEDEEKQKFLDDHLSIGKVVASGWGRTGSSSMLPNFAATFLPSGMGGDLFNGSRTTSASAGFMSMPTVGLIDSVFSLGKKMATNSIDPEKQYTKSDARAFFRILPYNNLIGINNLFNIVSKDLPNSSTVGDK